MRLGGWKGIDKESKVVKEKKDAEELKVSDKVEWVFFASRMCEMKSLRRGQQLFKKTPRRMQQRAIKSDKVK